VPWAQHGGYACAGRQGLVSSTDEVATGTDGVVDERAGCCATRYLMVWERNVESTGRWAETNCREHSLRIEQGIEWRRWKHWPDFFLHKMRALVERKGVGMTYLPKCARCRAFRGSLSSNKQIVDV
jgi:hypothetical protein